MIQQNKGYRCYICDSPITEENRTKEHIILNAIGGRLKSDRILCRKCNSDLGTAGDAVLAKQLGFLSGYLQVKREKGEIPTSEGGTTADGISYRLVNGIVPTLSKPVFRKTSTDNGAEFHIEARSESEMRHMLARIKREFDFFDIEAGMRKAVRYSGRMREPMRIVQEFGGTLAFQSIVKSAVNFYLHENGDKAQISHLIPMIKGDTHLDAVRYYHPSKPIYTKKPNEVIHLLHIKGNKHMKLLYCYVEFFSTHSYIVILSDQYTGKNINVMYANDPLTATEIKKEVRINLNREEILELPSKFSGFVSLRASAYC